MKHRIILLLLLTLILAVSCGGLKPTVFVHYDYNFNYVERVAVIPFENLSNDQKAGFRVTRFFINELLSKEAFDIVEPGEVKKVLMSYSISQTSELTRDQLIKIGNELKVQALFLGSVNESSSLRSGSSSTNVVSIVSRLVEVEEGGTIWSASHTAGGVGFWSSIFGSRSKSKSEVTRKCVKGVIKSLVK